MQTTSLKQTKIVILGAGFGGMYTLLHLHKQFHPEKRRGVEITLINRDNYFLFTPLLHEVATGSLNDYNIVEPVRKLMPTCLADFYPAEVQGVDVERQKVTTSLGEVPYDFLVVALGAETDFYGIAGAEERSFTLKSLRDAIRLKHHFIDTFEDASKLAHVEERKKLLSFAVVGGGPTGVELAAEMADFFYDTLVRYYPTINCRKEVCITLVNRGDELLGAFSPPLRKKALEVLRNRGVEVLLNTGVRRIAGEHITFDTGNTLDVRTVIWVAGVKPVAVPFTRPLETDESGRLLVKETLQTVGRPNIFALGDAASLLDEKTGRPVPMLAQAASKEGPVVAENLKRVMQHRALVPFSYHSQGELVSLGRWMAAGKSRGVFITGRFAWWIWRTVYLSKFISWRKRFKIAVDWTVNLFSLRDVSRL